MINSCGRAARRPASDEANGLHFFVLELSVSRSVQMTRLVNLNANEFIETPMICRQWRQVGGGASNVRGCEWPRRDCDGSRACLSGAAQNGRARSQLVARKLAPVQHNAPGELGAHLRHRRILIRFRLFPEPGQSHSPQRLVQILN